jgi:hypothetical protein
MFLNLKESSSLYIEGKVPNKFSFPLLLLFPLIFSFTVVTFLLIFFFSSIAVFHFFFLFIVNFMTSRVCYYIESSVDEKQMKGVIEKVF